MAAQPVPYVCNVDDPHDLECRYNPRFPTALFFNDGRVQHLKSGKTTYGSLSSNGYRNISLNNMTHRVHRLIGECFLDNADLPVCHHRNGIRWDNRAVNLEMCTHKFNTQGQQRRSGFGNVHEMPVCGRKRWKASYKIAGEPLQQRYFYDRDTAREWLDIEVLPSLQYLIHPRM